MKVPTKKRTSIIKSVSNNGGSKSKAGMKIDECSAGIPSILDDLSICGRDVCIDGPGMSWVRPALDMCGQAQVFLRRELWSLTRLMSRIMSSKVSGRPSCSMKWVNVLGIGSM
jgi:hypothetical protein